MFGGSLSAVMAVPVFLRTDRYSPQCRQTWFSQRAVRYQCTLFRTTSHRSTVEAVLRNPRLRDALVFQIPAAPPGVALSEPHFLTFSCSAGQCP